MSRLPQIVAASITNALVLLLRTASADDWPAWRHDVRHSAVSSEKLQFPLKLAWSYASAQAPSPAWPPPHFLLLNRVDFDYAPQPVVAGGMVVFGSSTDDTVRALDLATGRERWHFTTGGPVRLAPQIADGRVYFGSDDGVAWCLDAATGKLLWSHCGAPHDEQFIGNGRMISRWPIRTGVAVDGGVAYFAAGIWATEGVFVWALDARTGRVLWCNDTAGFIGVEYNTLLNPSNADSMTHYVHDGDFGNYGLTPQGAIALHPDVLFVPNGYTNPAGLDRRTGAVLHAMPQAGVGGHLLIVEGDRFYNSFQHRGGVNLMFGWDVRTAKRGDWLRGDMANLSAYPQPGSQARDIRHETGKSSWVIHGKKLIARNAYGLALAGETLLVGQNGFVAAEDVLTKKELWRAPVDGEAREIAVADGCVIEATSTGKVYCFAAGRDADTPVRGLSPRADKSVRVTAADADRSVRVTPGAAAILSRLRESGMDRGYALVVGDADGSLAQTLAAESALRVVVALADENDVRALREKLLAATTLYGSRIHVIALPSPERLPFAQYFANAVIVADPKTRVPGRELHRVLRPCGGVLLLPGVPAALADAILRDATEAGHPGGGAPPSSASSKPAPARIPDEIRGTGTDRFLVRGQLPGAFDWNNDVAADPLVRWPLRPIWFGGPTSGQVTDYKHGNVRPFAAYGRYFVLGENTLSAVDAYNGTVLWSRPITKYSADFRFTGGLLFSTSQTWSRELSQELSRTVRVNDRSVFLTLGKGCFRGVDGACVEIDARTGGQRRLYAPFHAGPRVSLASPQSWKLEVDDLHKGTLTMRREADALVLAMETRDPAVTRLDEWDLYFDLRPPDRRYGLYERGTFHVRGVPPVADAPAGWTRGAGEMFPRITVSGQRTPDGASVNVRIPLEELRQLAGERVASLGFAASLNSHDGGDRERIKQTHLFGTAMSDGINDGWATVVLDEAAPAPDPAKPPSIIAGPLSALPKEQVARGWPREMDAALRDVPRVHPLTGEAGPRIYRSGTGTCGGYDFSASSVIKRAGAAKLLGFYDFAEDDGFHGFVGTSANCAASTTTALGLVIASESKNRCVCTYPFRTSITFAPAERRLHEDWAIFYDRPADALVRQAALNLGAFGDRRAADGTLWLAFPRPAGDDDALGYAKLPGGEKEAFVPGIWPLPRSPALPVPLAVDCFDNGGPYRFSADRVPIRGTDRPWLYASGFRGIRRAALTVNLLQPIASAARTAPQLDGAISEWNDTPQVTLAATRTRVWLAHDAANLYIAASRPAPPPPKPGAPDKSRWTTLTHGEDANLFTDDSWELFLTDATSGRIAHFAVSASGARYDALCERDAKAEDKSWNVPWTSAVVADDKAFSVELAIPLRTLTAAGIDVAKLGVNFQMNRSNQVGEALTSPGWPGRTHCGSFTPLGLGSVPSLQPRRFHVRLHFAEPDEVAPGKRVFDVKLQGQVVLKAFDVAKAAGGPRTAVTREFANIEATRDLVVEFAPAAGNPGVETAPILSALEVREEGFPPAVAQAPR